MKGLHLRDCIRGFIFRIVGTVEEKRNDHFTLEQLLWLEPGWHSDLGLSWQ